MSTTRQQAGLDRLGCVRWFLPGAPRRGLGLASAQTSSRLTFEWKDHEILHKKS